MTASPALGCSGDETELTSLLQLGGLRATPPAVPVAIGAIGDPVPVMGAVGTAELHFLDSADPMPWEGAAGFCISRSQMVMTGGR